MYYLLRRQISLQKYIIYIVIINLLGVVIHLVLDYDIVKLVINFTIFQFIIVLTGLIFYKIINDKNYYNYLTFILLGSMIFLSLTNIIMYALFLLVIHKKNKNFNVDKS